MKRLLFGITSMFFVATMAGCVETVAYRVPIQPQPYEEVVTIQPYPSAIWIPGFWIWDGGHHRYHWRHGYWRRH